MPIFFYFIALVTFPVTFLVTTPDILVSVNKFSIVVAAGGVDGEHLIRVIQTGGTPTIPCWCSTIQRVPWKIAMFLRTGTPDTEGLYFLPIGVSTGAVTIFPKCIVPTQFLVVHAYYDISSITNFSSS